MIDEETLTYRYGAALALLLNVLATAMLVTFQVDVWPYATVGALANLFSYLVLLGALRRS